MKTKMLCKVAEISRSSFYYDEHSKQDAKDLEFFEDLQNTLGGIEELVTMGNERKVAEFAHKTGIHHNHKKIERISRKFGVKARFRRRKHPKNYYKEQKERRKNLPENKLNRDFNPTSPNEKLVTDISYFKVKEGRKEGRKVGWLYLSPKR